MRSKLLGCNTRNRQHHLVYGDSLDVLDKIEDESCRLVITSPPYNLGKEYERDCSRSLQEYLEWVEPILEKTCKKVTADGHLCWQVGNHVVDGEVFPLDAFFYHMIASKGYKLRNRIIWHFNFGHHMTRRFSGRYETVLWFTKSDNYVFNLEAVRVPQIYPGKRHPQARGERAGKPSGNPRGKNPADFWVFEPETVFKTDPVWNLPNVKASHPEKTIHPCQFPSELVERCVLALTQPGDVVMDPFVGAGTSVIAAAKHDRWGIGIDSCRQYIEIAKNRLDEQIAGRLITRPIGKPVRRPGSKESVARVPKEWKEAAG